jgi:hypothetical protein
MTEAPLLYRFTVKCDRDTNREIERLAKACNVSAQTYVQKHFETITGAAMAGVGAAVAEEAPAAVSRLPASIPPAPKYDDAEFDRPPPKPKMKRVRQSKAADRVLAALVKAKRPDGTVCVSQPKLADLAQSSVPTVLKYLDEMVAAGLVEIVTEGAKGRPTVYRVVEAPEGED